MNLDSLAKQANVKPSEAKMLHQRPAMIQELWWQRPLGIPSPEAGPVREVVFSFYNGELFRMVVNYDRYRTEGLTDEDMIGAISAKYGVATRPPAEIVSFSSSRVYNDSEKVLARWEDAQYSFNLFLLRTGLPLEWSFFPNGWMRWLRPLSLKRSGWTSRRRRNEKLNFRRSWMRNPDRSEKAILVNKTTFRS